MARSCVLFIFAGTANGADIEIYKVITAVLDHIETAVLELLLKFITVTK